MTRESGIESPLTFLSSIFHTELLYLGGANTRFWRSQLFPPLDARTVYNRGSGLIPLKLGYGAGYGVGMRLESQTGSVNVRYQLARGDSIFSGKNHSRMQSIRVSLVKLFQSLITLGAAS